jgi:hypothetical protein
MGVTAGAPKSVERGRRLGRWRGQGLSRTQGMRRWFLKLCCFVRRCGRRDRQTRAKGRSIPHCRMWSGDREGPWTQARHGRCGRPRCENVAAGVGLPVGGGRGGTGDCKLVNCNSQLGAQSGRLVRRGCVSFASCGFSGDNRQSTVDRQAPSRTPSLSPTDGAAANPHHHHDHHDHDQHAAQTRSALALFAHLLSVDDQGSANGRPPAHRLRSRPLRPLADPRPWLAVKRASPKALRFSDDARLPLASPPPAPCLLLPIQLSPATDRSASCGCNKTSSRRSLCPPAETQLSPELPARHDKLAGIVAPHPSQRKSHILLRPLAVSDPPLSPG